MIELVISMKLVYYLFRRPVQQNFKLAQKGKFPLDFFYGFNNLSGIRTLVSDSCESNKLITVLHQTSGKLFTKLFGLNPSFSTLLLQLPKIRMVDRIFATVDSYGIAMAVFKKLGFLKGKSLVYNTIGLCDILVDNPKLISFYQQLLTVVDMFISGASQTECNKLSQLLKIPINKFKFIPFGIDTGYFFPKNIREGDYILVIGADRKRDWELYEKIFKRFQHLQFIVITHPDSYQFSTFTNVSFYYNLPISKVRDYIAGCKFSLILSKQNYHFAGQSTAFRIMSMEKPVIVTDSWGVAEYKLISGKDCILVKPETVQAVIDGIKRLNADLSLRRRIGDNARKKIIKDLSLNTYVKQLANVFNTL